LLCFGAKAFIRRAEISMAKRARAKAGRPGQKPVRRTDGTQKAWLDAAARLASSRPIPPVQPPDAQALQLFQLAVEALHHRRYDVAVDQFQVVIDRFPSERALLDRTRVYLELAQRGKNRKPANPRTLEERITAATAALNNDQDAEAEKLVRAVLAEDSRHDLALYLMAAIEARRGDQDAALSYLSRSIAVSPEVRAQARHDADFDSLRHSEPFLQLVEPPASSSARRPRRGR
jgi:tetratricopeptide (TPR) repeat protein